jgi:hypothetical protein
VLDKLKWLYARNRDLVVEVVGNQPGRRRGLVERSVTTAPHDTADTVKRIL